jgi:hypothetical protein
VKRRAALRLALGALVAAPVGYFAWAWLTFPKDRTPTGAYYRLVKAVNNGSAEEAFPYIETAAQHACYTIRTYRKQGRDRVLLAYPEPERTRIAESYAAEASATDGADVFALYAKKHGWLDRLRRDMSGIHKIETSGDRATVETVKGTRYPLRRGENGIWGLTWFTGVLVTEAEKAARDAGMIEKAATDYERVRKAGEEKLDAGE